MASPMAPAVLALALVPSARHQPCPCSHLFTPTCYFPEQTFAFPFLLFSTFQLATAMPIRTSYRSVTDRQERMSIVEKLWIVGVSRYTKYNLVQYKAR